jgi:hypothetical protein
MAIERQSATRFVTTAVQFAEAARVLQRESEVSHKIDTPAYVLFGHSIEMALKGYLRASGWSPTKLRRQLGHDLNKALASAKTDGLESHVKINTQFEDRLDLLNQIHLTRELFYPRVGFVRLPLLKHVAEMADLLIRNIFPVVTERDGFRRKTLPKVR